MTGIFKRRIFIFLFFMISFTAGFAEPGLHFVLVHGAWHGAWCWFEVEQLLVREGYTVTTIHLPGHGNDNIDPGTVTLNDYRDKVTDFLDSLDHPIILVGHSMGGVVISAAAEKRPSKIDKLIYLSAFLLKNEQSLLDLASMDTRSKVLPNLTIDETAGVIKVDNKLRKNIFYQLSPERYVYLTENLLVPNPLQPFAEPLFLTDSGYERVRRFYITTTKDNAITAPFQKYMYTMSPCEKIYEIYTDHSAFFSAPNQLLNILLEIANDQSANLIKNPSFDNGKNNWAFTVYNPEDVSAYFTIDSTSQLSGINSAKFSLDSNGSQNWHIQLYQMVSGLKKDKTYEISFLAKHTASLPDTVKTSLFLIDLEFNTLWEQKEINLENVIQTRGPFTFISDEDIENALLTFDLEGNGNMVLYLDEIVMNPN